MQNKLWKQGIYSIYRNNLQTQAKPGAPLQTPLCYSLIHSLSNPLVKISLRRRHTLMVEDGDFSHKIDYVPIF